MTSAQNAKARKTATFNPDGVGNTSANIFGLPYDIDEAEVVIIPVPWDVTVSNLEGTSSGPQNILDQSPQIDLFDESVKDPWKAGIAMEEISQTIIKQNKLLRSKAASYIRMLEENPEKEKDEANTLVLSEVNKACASLAKDIREKSLNYLKQDKLVVLIGGDHSSPMGLMQAMTKIHPHFGVLQIDAHADLRNAYMGFTHSHASIMYNASQMEAISSFVQVGLRDISAREADMIQEQKHRFHPFFARSMAQRLFEGETWKSVCDDIISKLPQKVYISFDIDGLDPSQCPTTGTPVPGGLTYSQVLYLFEQIAASGKTIIGFDLVETGPGTTDGIVACRILYKTIALMLQSNRKV